MIANLRLELERSRRRNVDESDDDDEDGVGGGDLEVEGGFPIVEDRELLDTEESIERALRETLKLHHHQAPSSSSSNSSSSAAIHGSRHRYDDSGGGSEEGDSVARAVRPTPHSNSDFDHNIHRDNHESGSRLHP